MSLNIQFKKEKPPMIKVTYESRNFSDDNNSYEGREIADVFNELKAPFSMPDSSTLEVLVNGDDATFDDTIEADDQIEFVRKEPGKKGSN